MAFSFENVTTKCRVLYVIEDRMHVWSNPAATSDDISCNGTQVKHSLKARAVVIIAIYVEEANN